MEHDDRGVAEQRFYRIAIHYENNQPTLPGGQYNHPKLLGLMHEFAIPEKSKDHFLQAVFNAIGSSIQEQDDVDLSDNKTEHRIREKVVEFADYLIDNFFLPREPCLAFLAELGYTRTPLSKGISEKGKATLSGGL
ncbi:hypothetical protein E5D57_003392 [Metarhizium anisopliae]|nr:hypothetical protein E5D57_003392 [Metarhizium anisopliae]